MHAGLDIGLILHEILPRRRIIYTPEVDIVVGVSKDRQINALAMSSCKRIVHLRIVEGKHPVPVIDDGNIHQKVILREIENGD